MAPVIAPPEQLRAGGVVRELLAAWRDVKDLIEIGAYVAGTNPVVDRAVVMDLGAMLFAGTFDECMADPAVRDAYLGQMGLA